MCGKDDIDCNSTDLMAHHIKCQCPTEKYTYRGHLKCSAEKFLTKVDFKHWYGPVYFEELNKTLPLMGTVPFSYIDIHSMSVGAVDLPRNFDEVDQKILWEFKQNRDFMWRMH